MQTTRIDALIFDVDGTLADTEEAHRTAFNLAFERCGLDWKWSRTDYRALLATTGGKERMARHIATLDTDDAERARLRALIPQIHAAKTRFYSAVVRDGAVPLRAGVARLLDEARHAGCRLAIASTTTAVNVDALLHATLGPRALELFGVIACGDQVAHKKPAPDIYLLALQHLGVRADHAIAFEDSANGLAAARAAGLWTVVTPTFWSEDGDFADAGLLLPHLGDAAHPLAQEPGRRLRDQPWLGFGELCRLAARSGEGALS
ncbi:MAG: HAD-IA family hydrolase [Gammaproteobacteria bacterium]|jgi:HAD superfamily hydrolase (TIGR01509 family)|nr:HAD-IA family hydrolase [Gammaproteobacteria bacterium]